MITRPIQRAGDHFVVTIPEDEIKRQGLEEGQVVGIIFTPDEYRPRMRPELRKVMDQFWADHGEDFLAWAKEDMER